MKITIETWYQDQMYNANNSPAYIDMIKDMALLNDGVFTCTFKLDNGNICDYVVMENGVYVED